MSLLRRSAQRFSTQCSRCNRGAERQPASTAQPNSSYCLTRMAENHEGPRLNCSKARQRRAQPSVLLFRDRSADCPPEFLQMRAFRNAVPALRGGTSAPSVGNEIKARTRLVCRASPG